MNFANADVCSRVCSYRHCSLHFHFVFFWGEGGGQATTSVPEDLATLHIMLCTLDFSWKTYTLYNDDTQQEVKIYVSYGFYVLHLASFMKESSAANRNIDTRDAPIV